MVRLSPLYRKSLADVSRRKARSLLAITGILIAVFGLVTVIEASELLNSSFFYSTDPAGVPDMYFTVDTFPLAVAMQVKAVPNLARLEVRSIYVSHWDDVPKQQNTQPSLEISAYPATTEAASKAEIWSYQLISGRLPEPGEIVLDVGALAFKPVQLGDRITIDTPNGHPLALKVVGLARTHGLAVWHTPAWAVGYMSKVGLEQVVSQNNGSSGNPFPRGSQLLIQLHDSNRVQESFHEISNLLNTAQLRPLPTRTAYRFSSYNGDLQLPTAGLLLVTGLLTLLAISLVAVMIFNVVNSLLGEQTKIIGTMKAMGGTRWQIARSYLLSVALYSVLGTALGMEIGFVAGYELAVLLSSQLETGPLSTPLSVGSFRVSGGALLAGLLIGLAVPLLSAFWPLWRGTKITVREAISTYGLQNRIGVWFKRPNKPLQKIPQIYWLAWRNLFRKPGRTGLTFFALSLGATVFVAVQITNASLHQSVNADNVFHSDLRIDLTNLGQVVPLQPVLNQLKALPNVAQIEPFDPYMITIAGREMQLLGVEPANQLYKPHLVAGNWLEATDTETTFVINKYAAEQLQLRVGQQITIQSEETAGVQVKWRLVGIVDESFEVSPTANSKGRLGVAFTSLKGLNSLRHQNNEMAARLWLQANDNSPQALQQLKHALEQTLDKAGLVNSYVGSPLERVGSQPDPLLYAYLLFDGLMLLIALLGLMALTHTIATAVLERRLEIGIMRSLGAVGWQVGQVFSVESLTLAVLAWLGGSLVGVVGGIGLVNLLSQYFGPIEVGYSPLLLVASFSFSLVVALFASFGPVLNAARVRVREVLHYE